jgi:hypothetical protein
MTFTSGQLNAADLQTKFDDAFDYCNVGISSGSITSGSLITEDLGRGDYLAVVPDHFFMSGDHLSSGRAKGELISNDMTYNTATIKTFWPRDRILYTSQAGCARSCYFEKIGRALVTISGWVQDFDNSNARAVVTQGSESGNTTSSVAVNSNWYLHVDGTIVDNTVNRSFEEDSGSSPTDTSIATGITNMAAFERRRRRLHITRMAGPLSPGWHTFGLVTDTRNELSRLGNFNISVEVFYNTGLEDAGINNLPLSYKLPDSQF